MSAFKQSDIHKQLEKIANSFAFDSDECNAIKKATLALFELERISTIKKFEEFINDQHAPLTGYQLLNCKICGVEIPELKKTPELIQLEKEIDVFAEKLIAFRATTE